MDGLEDYEALIAPDLRHLPDPPSRPAAVVHLAAETNNQAHMFDVNVRGSAAVLEWAVRHRATQFIYMSSVGVYGPTCQGLVTPAMARRPETTYERTKAEAEELVLRIGLSGKLAVTMLQPSSVFGAGPEWARPLVGFMRSVSRGRFRYLGRKEAYFNYVDARDVARACVEVLRPEAYGRTFILNDPLPLSRVVAIVAGAAGIKPPRSRLPYAIALPVAATLSGLAVLSRRPVPLDLGRFRALTNRTTYDGSDIQVRLGFRYSVGTERGLRELAHHYRALLLL
jgi:dihydroflavonol-4-reductase